MQKNKKKEEIKITLENCEGYVELHNKSVFSVDELDKIQNNILKAGVIDFIVLISFIASGVFTANLFVTVSLILGTFAAPLIVYIQNSYSIERKHEKEIASRYPDINTNVSHDELEETLKMTGILKYEYDKNGCISEHYDIKGYKNCILANQIKKEMIEEQSYKSLKSDFTVSNKEMDKVKVKVKTMVRK